MFKVLNVRHKIRAIFPGILAQTSATQVLVTMVCLTCCLASVSAKALQFTGEWKQTSLDGVIPAGSDARCLAMSWSDRSLTLSTVVGQEDHLRGKWVRTWKAVRLPHDPSVSCRFGAEQTALPSTAATYSFRLAGQVDADGSITMSGTSLGCRGYACPQPGGPHDLRLGAEQRFHFRLTTDGLIEDNDPTHTTTFKRPADIAEMISASSPTREKLLPLIDRGRASDIVGQYSTTVLKSQPAVFQMLQQSGGTQRRIPVEVAYAGYRLTPLGESLSMCLKHCLVNMFVAQKAFATSGFTNNPG